MLRKRKSNQQYSATIQVQEVTLPVLIVMEPRGGFRYSLSRKKVIVRLPAGLATDAVHEHLAQVQRWLHELSVKKPQPWLYF